jgi:hypothetical protein
MKTTRKLIAGATLATGLLFSAVAPAQADRGGYNQTPERCEKIERITTRLVNRVVRLEERVARAEARIEAGVRPQAAARLEAKIVRLEARIDLEFDLYDEFELYCDGLDGDLADIDTWDDLDDSDEDGVVEEEPPADECPTSRIAADGDDADEEIDGGIGSGDCSEPETTA